MSLSSALMLLAPIPAAFVAGLRGQSKDEVDDAVLLFAASLGPMFVPALLWLSLLEDPCGWANAGGRWVREVMNGPEED